MTVFEVEYRMTSSRAWNRANEMTPAVSPTRADGSNGMSVAPADSLAQLYSREELVFSTREKHIDWTPIKVGTGPFDLAPEETPPCTFCGDYLIDRVDHEGNVSALGLGVWKHSGGWVVAHSKCVRQIEDESCPCTCHARLLTHGAKPESVCCERFNEVGE